MDALDDAAAKAFQNVRINLRKGVWSTGELGAKGYVVTEVMNASDQSNQDGIKRYTDRYQQRKTIGRLAKDFPINPQFLPSELHKAVGLVSSKKAEGKPETDRLSRVEHLATLNEDDRANSTENAANNDNEDEDKEENVEEVEDEFEELDDDDYNAEKYFDDGDDYGDGDDDGDNEAAY